MLVWAIVLAHEIIDTFASIAVRQHGRQIQMLLILIRTLLTNCQHIKNEFNANKADRFIYLTEDTYCTVSLM